MSTPRVLGWLPLQLFADIQIIVLVAAICGENLGITPVFGNRDYNRLTSLQLKWNSGWKSMENCVLGEKHRGWSYRSSVSLIPKVRHPNEHVNKQFAILLRSIYIVTICD